MAALEAEAYKVPTERPEADGTQTWASTTAVVVTVTGDGGTGLGWTYAPAAAADVVRDLLAPAVTGTDPMDVPGAYRAMRRAARNALVPGLVTAAISAVDVALWDLKAILLGTPLAALLGRVRPAVPLYGSGGFTTYDDETLYRQLNGWVFDDGIPRVKIKIGESWGHAADRDLARMRIARETVGTNAELYVDANGGYTAKQAIRVLRAAEDLDVRWFEEPVSSDDLAGLAQVRAEVTADVAAGEYGTDPVYFRRMCAAGAVDCLQVDLTRSGGYTGFMYAAAVADAYNLQVSTHTAPQLHAPVAAAIPNARHIEWFADHVRLERMLFDGLADPAGGDLAPQYERPGHGLTLRREDAAPYRTG
ncbi:enolase C-terminal domain-like protein [Phytohabitans flavus]|uniref:enolase C-terminal domain-like protein n=1 Tax=Phytohabitans flavus TaxID=1076124 RepID=UPI001E3706A1|nr:enolase C-terminal domain-like protein [Phytohabitans flavus]